MTGVEITTEDLGGGIMMSSANVTITNNSEGRSNYFIDVSIESADGATRYESTSVYASNVEPGQTTTETAPLMEAPPGDSVAKVKQVERTAAT